MELQNLSLTELRQLQADIDKAIKAREQEELEKARREILSIAERIGLPLDSLLAASGKNRKTGGTVAVKYRHPDNASLQWTGRGRQPKWVKEYLDAGGVIEGLELK